MPTFDETVRLVRLHASAADPLLVRTWVQQVYDDLADRYPWHFLFAETILTTRASRTLTATVTNASTAVTSAALFVSTDLNRQFRVGSGPIYTIVTFTNTSNVVLDKVYAGTAGAVTATIRDYLARMPADFGALEVVWDPTDQRPLVYGVSRTDLMGIDIARTESDRPRALVDFDIDTTGRVRYEYWPAPSSAEQFPALYKQRPQALAAGTSFRGVLNNRTDVLIEGALAKAARWPGTTSVRNPYFNLGLADRHQTEFDRKVHTLGLRDDDQALQSWSAFPWPLWRAGGVSSTTGLLRSTDADLSDYA